MQTSKKKEYGLVIFFVLFIASAAFFIAKDHAQLQTVVSKEQLLLGDEDFIVKVGPNDLFIGSSTREEVLKMLPRGKTLGMSTIYKPESPDCLLTFNEDEEILQKIHIYNQDIQTKRGAKVGDAFTLVTEKYGPNYSSVGYPGKAKDFDAVYGAGNNIIFQVRDDKVKTIILQKE
ncbi:MAG: hypothetical protein PHX14_00130 [Syntrophomonadaceae bacterium]|nr:hypothetical protein [Syntrophomonadaceae bacterium]